MTIPKELLWFALGIAATLISAAFIWASSLLMQNFRMRREITGLMHNKGELTMRISILEDVLKEKERK